MNEVKIEGKAREWGWGIQETGVGPGTGGVLSGRGVWACRRAPQQNASHLQA